MAQVKGTEIGGSSTKKKTTWDEINKLPGSQLLQSGNSSPTHTSSSGQTHGGGGGSFGTPKPNTDTNVSNPSSSTSASQELADLRKEQIAINKAASSAANPAKATPAAPKAPTPAAPKAPAVSSGGTSQNNNPIIVQPQSNGVTGTKEEPVISFVEDTAAANAASGGGAFVDTGPSIADLIQQMLEAQRQSRIAAYDKSYQAALASLAEQEARLPQQYYDAANRAAAQSDIAALNHAQYAAGQGIRGASAALPEMYRNVALQGQLGSLERQKLAALDALSRDRAGLTSAYESDKMAALADIDAQGLQAYINQMNADRLFGLQEAGLTGLYRGTPTMAAQNQAFNQGVALAGLTGMYNGQPTFDYQKWLADTEYKNRTFEENVRQFEREYGLNLRQMEIDEAQRAIDNAYKNRQLTLQEAQQALTELKYVMEQAGKDTGGIGGVFGATAVYGDAKNMLENGQDKLSVIDYIMKSGLSESEKTATLSRLGYTDADIDEYERITGPAYMGEFRLAQ